MATINAIVITIDDLLCLYKSEVITHDVVNSLLVKDISNEDAQWILMTYMLLVIMGKIQTKILCA